MPPLCPDPAVQVPQDGLIPFGSAHARVVLPTHVQAEWLKPRTHPAGSELEVLEEALANPIGSPRLRDAASGKGSAVILVPGKDRVAGVGSCLPLLMEELDLAGIPASAITIVVATGTHVRHTEQELAAILGPATAARIRFRQHDSASGDHFVGLATTTRGTRIELDREVVGAGIKVLVGQILPHYFAGFGGGRKALLPGVASRRTILQNHRLTLDETQGIHSHVAPCSLRGNPVHEDMLEAAGMVDSVFILNTLMDECGRVVAAYSGDMEKAHLAGCAMAEKVYVRTVDTPVDAAITSPGGWPYDCDFVQSLKALFHVRDIVRPGGGVLWVAECAQGMKEGFRRWASHSTLQSMEAAVRAHYDLAGHNSLMLRAMQQRVQIGLVSALPEEDVRALGIEPLRSLEGGLEWLSPWLTPGARCAVLPAGNITLGRLPESAR